MALGLPQRSLNWVKLGEAHPKSHSRASLAWLSILPKVLEQAGQSVWPQLHPFSPYKTAQPFISPCLQRKSPSREASPHSQDSMPA